MERILLGFSLETQSLCIFWEDYRYDDVFNFWVRNSISRGGEMQGYGEGWLSLNAV